jgi:CHAT domain-containing protein
MKLFSQLTKSIISLGFIFISYTASASNKESSEIDKIISESLIDLSQSEKSDLMIFAKTKLAVKNLILAGKGIQALELSESSIEKVSNSEVRSESISLTIDICLMLEDHNCFNRVSVKYANELVNNSNKHFEIKPGDKPSDISVQKHHRLDGYQNLHKFYFSDIANLYKSEINNEVLGLWVDSKYSSFSRTSYALRNISNFNTKDGLQQLRLSRALMLSNDLDDFITQWHYANLVNNSTFSFNDLSDVRNLIEIKRIYKTIKNIDVTESFNPYAKILLLLSEIESGLLSDEEYAVTKNEILKLFNNLEINQESNLGYRKSRFYAFSILESVIQKNEYDKDLLKKLEESNDSYESISTLALVSLIKGDIDSANKDNLQRQIEHMKSVPSMVQAGSLWEINNIGSLSLMESLLCRLNAIYSCEKENLVNYLNSYLQLKNKYIDGFSAANTGVKSDRLIVLYAINRLRDMGYKSDLLDNTYFVFVNSIYESNNLELVRSRSLVSSFKDDVNKNAAKQFINTVSVYNEMHYKSFFSLFHKYKPIKEANAFKSFGSKDYIGHAITLLADYENSWLYTNKYQPIQLKEVRSQVNPGELIILASEYDDINYMLLIDKYSIKYKAIDSKNNDLQALRNLISGNEIHHSNSVKIDELSLSATRALFSEDNISKYKKIFIVSGTQIAGIPYTLFKFKNNNASQYLIEKTEIVSFDTVIEFNDYRASLKKDRENKVQRNIRYMAFANPKFNSSSSEDSYALLIRGGSGASLNNLALLPETETEAIKFASNIPGNSKLFFGNNASKENFLKQNYDDVEILTIASHGVLSGEIIESNSASIVLTSSVDNGLVDINSLMATYGAPKLVVLSTCNSATYDYNINFSQVASISNAYQLKGSNSVVASLWQVDTFATQRLMIGFSNYLKTGMTSPEALRFAQIDMLNTSYSHPSLWAAFVVTGVYEPIGINTQSHQTTLVSQVLPNKEVIGTAHSGNIPIYL